MTELQVDTIIHRLYERRYNILDQYEKVIGIHDRKLKELYEHDLEINQMAINRMLAYQKNMFDLSSVVSVLDSAIDRLKGLVSV